MIKERHQIGNYADACNECGNCDVFCPEDGGPYIEKPRFFGSLEAYKKWPTYSGFVLQSDKKNVILFGRFKDQEFELHRDQKSSNTVFKNHSVQVTLNSETNEVVDATGTANTVMDLRYYFVMNALLKGILNKDRVHFVNAGIVS